MKRFSLFAALISAILILSNIHVIVRAQVDLDPLDANMVDAALGDLGSRLGKPLTRNDTPWYIAPMTFKDTSLGCPAAGQSYEAKTIRGVRIRLTAENPAEPSKKKDYEYRAIADGSLLISCIDGVPGPAIPVVIPPPATPVPDQPVDSVQPDESTPDQSTVETPKEMVTYQTPILYTDLYSVPRITGVEGITTTPVKTGTEFTDQYLPSTAWSPDGTKIAIGESDRISIAQTGQSPKLLLERLLDPNRQPLNVAWSPDGQQVAFLVTNDPGIELKAVSIAGGEPRTIASIEEGEYCATGSPRNPISPYDSYIAQNSEIEDYHPSLFWLNAGLLYSSCDQIGLHLKDLNGKQVWMQPDLVIPTPSPDGTRILAFHRVASESAVTLTPVLVDTATGNYSPLTLPDAVTNMAWSSDGQTLFYTTRSKSQEIPGMMLYKHTFTLWQSAIGGQPNQVFSIDDYIGVESISVRPDNGAVLLTLITESGSYMRGEVVFIPVGGTPTWIAVGRNATFGKTPFAGEKGVVSPDPMPQCDNARESRLQYGLRAKVPAGKTVNLREQPIDGKILAKLKEGDIMLMLDGPQCGDDGLPWWIVNYNGVVGFVAEGKNQFYWLEP